MKRFFTIMLALGVAGTIACGDTSSEDDSTEEGDEKTTAGLEVSADLQGEHDVEYVRFALTKCSDKDDVALSEKHSLHDLSTNSSKDDGHTYLRRVFAVSPGCYDLHMELLDDQKGPSVCPDGHAEGIDVRIKKGASVHLVSKCEKEKDYKDDDDDDRYKDKKRYKDLKGHRDYRDYKKYGDKRFRDKKDYRGDKHYDDDDKHYGDDDKYYDDDDKYYKGYDRPEIKSTKYYQKKVQKCPKARATVCATAKGSKYGHLDFEWKKLKGPEVKKGPKHVKSYEKDGYLTECVSFKFKADKLKKSYSYDGKKKYGGKKKVTKKFGAKIGVTVYDTVQGKKKDHVTKSKDEISMKLKCHKKKKKTKKPLDPPTIKFVKSFQKKLMKCPKAKVVLCAVAKGSKKGELKFDWKKLKGPEVKKGPKVIKSYDKYGYAKECVSFKFKADDLNDDGNNNNDNNYNDENDDGYNDGGKKYNDYKKVIKKFGAKIGLTVYDKVYTKKGKRVSKAKTKIPVKMKCKKKKEKEPPEIVLPIIEELKYCPRTHGFWKTHPDDWPDGFDPDDPELTIFEGVTFMDALWTPPRGDMCYILAKQYIAAILNISKNVDLDDDFDEYDAEDALDELIFAAAVEGIETADKLDDFLWSQGEWDGQDICPGLTESGDLRDDAQALKDHLESFNKDEFTPACEPFESGPATPRKY